MQIKKHIPNFITSLNLVSGSLAIILLMHNNTAYASVLIFVAAVFDFFDGMAARLLHVKSEIGKQLDSLADVVSFGLVPGMILYKLTSIAIIEYSGPFWQILPYVSLLVPVFSALRLAKFNIDTRQEESFLGLPTPANALLIAALDSPMGISAHLQTYPFLAFMFHPVFLASLAFVFSLLLVIEVPLFALKFKNFRFKGNEIRFILILTSVVLILFFSVASLVIIIPIYIVLSLINNFISKRSAKA